MLTAESKNGKIKVKFPQIRNAGFAAITKMAAQAVKEINTSHGTLKKALLGCDCEKCSLVVRRAKQTPSAVIYLKNNFPGITTKSFKQWLNSLVDKSFSTKYIDVFELDFPKFRAIANSKFAEFDQVTRTA